MPKIVSFSNTAWYLSNYRLPIDRILRDRGWEIVMASPDDRFRPKIEAAGFRWREIRMSRSGINPFEEIATVRQVAAILREEKPDILHTFTMKGNVNGSLGARLAGVRNVVNSIAGLGFVYSSDAPLARALRAPAGLLYRAALSRGRVIFQNGEDLDIFVRQGMVAHERAALIRSSGVDVQEFQPSPRPADGPVRVLYAARLLWTKGLGELVQAAEELRRRGVEIELLVAGEPDPGNPASIPAAQLEAWQQAGLVRCLGFQSDMAGLMATCHIICFPSKHKEGTPRFLVEAAAAGLPIVTTRNRGCVEVVRDGVNGILVPVGAVAELADALQRLAGDQELRERMGAEGRRIAEEEFSVDQVADRTEAVYRELLGDAATA
jgi:glycosyltransferase involved in cell wall biosynthesis